MLANQKRLEFKIIGFDIDTTLLVGKDHLSNTLQIFEIRNRVDAMFHDVFNFCDMEILKNDAVRYME